MARNAPHGDAMKNLGKHHIGWLLTILLSAFATHTAYACQGRPYGSPTFTIGPSLTLNYSGTLTAGSIPVTVTMPTGMITHCNLGFLVYTEPRPIVWTLQSTQSPQSTLSYSITAPFEYTGDSMIHRIYATKVQTFEFSIPFQIPANQTGRPAGSYQRVFTTRLYNVITGGAFQETSVLVTVNIAPSCTLPPPTASVLDFSPAIQNGRIPATYQRTLSFNNAGCNGPARITLSGQPMKIPGNATAPSIHYAANAILGNAAVTLDTRASSSSIANMVTAPVSGSIPVSITVLPTAAPLLAGTYSSVLQVSLEPSQ